MEELVDLIATDASSRDVSDSIKNALMQKAAARIDAFRPEVAADVFGSEQPEAEEEYEDEVVDEVDYEDEESTEEDYE